MILISFQFSEMRNKKAPCLNRQSAELSCSFLIFRFIVGFGTLKNRLPWFHWAVPSATLDKV